MANEKQDEKKVVEMPNQEPKLETKELTNAQRSRLGILQQAIQDALTVRNQYIIGLADGMELDGTWQFDFDSFLNGRGCRFIRPVKQEEKK